MRKAMLASQGQASCGVANGDSSAPQISAMDVAPMETMEHEALEGDEEEDEDAAMIDAEHKVCCIWPACIIHILHSLHMNVANMFAQPYMC